VRISETACLAGATASRAAAARRVPRGWSGERGTALLPLLALGVVIAVGALAAQLQPVALRQAAERRTASALAEARAALVGYAASDPNRPGELPCPDFNGDGRSMPGQDYVGGRCRTLCGWLPWYTLRLPEMRDGSGERLWYAVSETFRAGGPATLNSDTAGELALDGRTDVVAVVAAPGAAVGEQVREATADAEAAAVNRLEDSNALLGTTRFVSSGPGVNDRVVALTRADLLAAVEERVLSEVAAALHTYRRWTDAGHGGDYPWLASFADARSPDFLDLPLSRKGLLPFHVPRGEFRTSFTVEGWTVRGAAVRLSRIAGNTVAPEDLTSGSARHVGLSDGDGRCVWSDLETASCRGWAQARCAAAAGPCRLPAGVARRVWDFDLSFRGTPSVTPPSAGGHATRTVALQDGALPDQRGPAIGVTDYDGNGRLVGSGELLVGAPSTVTGAVGADATIGVSGIRLYPVLPEWYAANAWYRYVYLAVAPAHVPGLRGPTPCAPGVDCLTLTNRAGAVLRQDVRVLALLGGAFLPGMGGGLGSPNACLPDALCSRFESGNADGDDHFVLDRRAGDFNDRLRTLDPPGG